MPIQLTSAFDAGDWDAGKTYGQARIVFFSLDNLSERISLTVQLGNTVSGKWETGRLPLKEFVIEDKPHDLDENGDPIPNTDDPQYTTLVDKLCPDTSTRIYDASATEMYQWLLDQGHYAGTIV